MNRDATNESLMELVLLICILFMLTACSYSPRITETNDISDYGVLRGTGTIKSDHLAEKEFFALFPASISPFFEDVHYHYKAIDDYTFAFEASLEFTISDWDSFCSYIDSIAPMAEFDVFPYADGYFEYLPQENYLGLSVPDSKKTDEGERSSYYRIDEAKISRILIQPSEQKVLFILLSVKEDHWTKTTDLDDFFSRFSIDPKEFAERYPFESTVVYTTD